MGAVLVVVGRLVLRRHRVLVLGDGGGPQRALQRVRAEERMVGRMVGVGGAMTNRMRRC